MTVNGYWPNDESWKRFWPTRIATLIAVIQLLISFPILGLHCGIVIIFFGTCYYSLTWVIMGFVCWVFFLICWISIFCVSCCNRSSVGCATYVMITNILAFIFSAVLIDFDNKFISGTLAVELNIECSLSSFNDFDTISVLPHLAKGQLAGAVIILVLSLTFVGIYIYTYIRSLLNAGTNFENNHPSWAQPVRNQTQVVPSSQPIPFYMNPDNQLKPMDKHITTVICQRCGARVEINQQF